MFINETYPFTKSVKCINVDWSYSQDLELGSIYTATPTTDIFMYYIHELGRVVPKSMFVDIVEFRESTINSILGL
jgi:hypothetical protein